MSSIVAALSGPDKNVITSSAFKNSFGKNFVLAFVLCQLFYSLSYWFTTSDIKNKQVTQLQHRIALDLNVLNDELPLSIKGDERSRYLQSLNNQLQTQNYGIQVQQVSEQVLAPSTDLYVTELNAVDKPIYIEYFFQTPGVLNYIGVLPALLALLFSYIYSYVNTAFVTQVKNEDNGEPDPLLLTIDLKQKVLINHKTNKAIALANKPLCFYAALLEYCVLNPDSQLNPNKDLPEDLSRLCKKYFARLIELGHTIRKRPDFSNNLEKTLSEIRAALDELYGDDTQTRAPLYPKKAVGEGSRSKAHSYALTDIEQQMIEILGS